MSHDPREFRSALGQFATGVCLITCVTARGEPLALTANSFAAVSLDPPLVLWSLQFTSDAFDDYAAAQHFAINVLGRSQEALSSRYATKGNHVMDPGHFVIGDNGAPIVNDALASFECEVEATHPGGDHVIIVGRVSRFNRTVAADPLLFYSGAYGALG